MPDERTKSYDVLRRLKSLKSIEEKRNARFNYGGNPIYRGLFD